MDHQHNITMQGQGAAPIAVLVVLMGLPGPVSLRALRVRGSTALEQAQVVGVLRLRGGAVYNASWEPSYKEGRPSAWAAARVGDIDALRRALDSQALDATDEDGRTPLHWATMAGQQNVVAELLHRGCSALTMDAHGWSPLHCAASSSDAALLKLLLQAGQAENPAVADIVTADDRAATPLVLACGKNSSEVVALLLEACSNATVSRRDADGFSPILRAGVQARTEILDLLLARGASIDELDLQGNSSLHYVCQGLSKSRIPLALSLLQRGADPLVENHAGDTPVDSLDMDVAKALSRELLAWKRSLGLARRSEEEQASIEQNMVMSTMESLASSFEGPDAPGAVFHHCCGQRADGDTDVHDEAMCTRVRANVQLET